MNDFKYQHIIWDWNGTLFDDAWLCVEVMNGILLRRRMPPLTPAYYQSIFDFPVIEYYQKLGFDFSTEPFATISTEFITEYEKRRPECGLKPGALQALKGSKKRGITQSILSASKQTHLNQAIEQFRIRDMFGVVAGLDNHHAFGKTAIGRRLISEIGLDPEAILLIGDTIHDYEVAQAIGVDCCLIPSGHQNPQRLASCGTRVINSFSELWNR
jgi:phosphoglycolate phosphatase